MTKITWTLTNRIIRIIFRYFTVYLGNTCAFIRLLHDYFDSQSIPKIVFDETNMNFIFFFCIKHVIGNKLNEIHDASINCKQGHFLKTPNDCRNWWWCGHRCAFMVFVVVIVYISILWSSVCVPCLFFNFYFLSRFSLHYYQMWNESLNLYVTKQPKQQQQQQIFILMA